MTTSIDEALADDWRRTHSYTDEVVCDCGEAWMALYIDGEPTTPETVTCSVCGGEGKPR